MRCGQPHAHRSPDDGGGSMIVRVVGRVMFAAFTLAGMTVIGAIVRFSVISPLLMPVWLARRLARVRQEAG